MTPASSRHLQRFLAAASLALGIPLAVAAMPDQAGRDCPGYAPAMQGHPGQPGGEPMPHQLRALNLSEAQRDAVFAIMHEQAPAMRDNFKTLAKAESDLRQLVGAADYSEGKAKVLAEAIGKATSDMALLRGRTDRKIFELLTPEQRKQMAEQKPGNAPRARPEGAPREGMRPPR